MRHGARLHRYLRVELRHESDAHDALQESLTAAWRGLPGLRRADRFWPWLVGIASHKAADVHRRRSRDLETEARVSHEDDLLLETREALSALPAQQREALLLRYLLGLSEEEAAVGARRTRGDDQVAVLAGAARAARGAAMRRHRQDQEQVIRALLARLDEEAADPTEAELRRAARLAAGEGRTPGQRPAPRSRPWRPLRLRWAAAVRRRSSLPPASPSASPPGSLRQAARGRSSKASASFPRRAGRWSRSGSPAPPSRRAWWLPTSRCRLSDPGPGQPLALHAWPPWATVIDATLKARGEPARDAAFPVRSLPLTLADARPVTVPGQPTLEYVLRAAVSGYNVDASVTFASEPTDAMFEKAEEQIARLVVAPAASRSPSGRRSTAARTRSSVSGSVTSGKKDEKVTLQFKQCGLLPAPVPEISPR